MNRKSGGRDTSVRGHGRETDGPVTGTPSDGQTPVAGVPLRGRARGGPIGMANQVTPGGAQVNRAQRLTPNQSGAAPTTSQPVLEPRRVPAHREITSHPTPSATPLIDPAPNVPNSRRSYPPQVTDPSTKPDPSLLKSLHKNRQTLYQSLQHQTPAPGPSAGSEQGGRREDNALAAPSSGSLRRLSLGPKESSNSYVSIEDRPDWNSSTQSLSFNHRYSAQQDYKWSYPAGEAAPPTGHRRLPRPIPAALSLASITTATIHQGAPSPSVLTIHSEAGSAGANGNVQTTRTERLENNEKKDQRKLDIQEIHNAKTANENAENIGRGTQVMKTGNVQADLKKSTVKDGRYSQVAPSSSQELERLSLEKPDSSLVDLNESSDSERDLSSRSPQPQGVNGRSSVAKLLTGMLNYKTRRTAWDRPPAGRGHRELNKDFAIGNVPQGEIGPRRVNAQENDQPLRWHQSVWRALKSWWRRKSRKHQENPIFLQKIKNIEGQFGSGTVGFLLFVRHLMMMNVVLAALWILLVILPQSIDFDYSIFTKNFYMRNFLDGQKALSLSLMFYGNYSPEVGVYPLALVYLVVIILTYFGGLFVVLRSVARALEDEGGRHAKDIRHMFSKYVLTSWDFTVTSAEGVTSLSMGIASQLRDEMSEIKTMKTETSISRKEWWKLVARRGVAWTITVILIGAGCTLISLATNPNVFKSFLVRVGYEASQSDDNIVVVFGPTVIFMVINQLVPLCVYKLSPFERYAHPKTELHISIGRVFVLRTANLLSLVISVYLSVGEVRSGCTGTLIGQELYKVVVLDTLIGVVQDLVPQLASFYWTREKSDFDMAESVLTVIDRQALIWMGTVVCPVLPLVGVATMTITFLTTYLILRVTCRPPAKRWNQPRRNSFLMALTAATLGIILVPVSVVITRQDVIHLGQVGGTGSFCGPFLNHTMTDVVLTFQHQHAPRWLKSVMGVIFSTTALLPAILVMLALIYYQRMRVRWEKRKRLMLAAELEQEREESKELLRKLHTAAVNTFNI